MKTVVCFGDSNTRGFDPYNGGRYPRNVRWTGILQEKLGYQDYYVVEEALNGRTTMIERKDDPKRNGVYYIEPCVGSHQPVDILIISLGTNDCLKQFNMKVEDIASGMENLINTVEAYTTLHQFFVPKIILMTPASINRDYHNSNEADQINDETVLKSETIGKYYKEIAKKHNCIYVDANDYIQTCLPDAVHMDDKGHQKIASVLAEVIKNI